MTDYDELHRAFLEDETARYLVPPEMPGSPRGSRPLHDIAWDEPAAEAHLSYMDVDAAVSIVAQSLADRTGNSLQDVISLAAQLATGGTEEERAAAIVALSDAVDSMGCDPETIVLAAMTQEEREKPSAHTIAGTDDWPIPDKKHLAVALGFYKQGKLGGHSKDAVRAHILTHAKRLGVPVNLDDDADDDADDRDTPPSVRHTKSKVRSKVKPKSQGGGGTDGSDSFHSGGGASGMDVGGPSGAGDGAGVSMAASVARRFRMDYGPEAADELRLVAMAHPDDTEVCLSAARLCDLADDQGMNATDSEVMRLTRDYTPERYGHDPEVVALAREQHRDAARTPAERRAIGEADRIVGDARERGEWPGLPEVHDTGSRTGSARHSGKAHPGRPRKVTTRTRAHAPDGDDASHDHHAAIQRYLAEVQRMSAVHPAPDKAISGSESTAPKSPAQRTAEERREGRRARTGSSTSRLSRRRFPSRAPSRSLSRSG